MSSLTNWVNETPERRRTYEQERLIVDVAEAVQGLLDKAGMKRAELGRRTGIARQSLHQMLSGQQNLTLRTMATIAHELGYRVSVSFEPYSAQETSVGPDADVASKAACSCKHSDTWRCAVARGLTSVSCGCRCHRATANRESAHE